MGHLQNKRNEVWIIVKAQIQKSLPIGLTCPFFSCDQAAQWMVQSVRLSVCPHACQALLWLFLRPILIHVTFFIVWLNCVICVSEMHHKTLSVNVDLITICVTVQAERMSKCECMPKFPVVGRPFLGELRRCCHLVCDDLVTHCAWPVSQPCLDV